MSRASSIPYRTDEEWLTYLPTVQHGKNWAYIGHSCRCTLCKHAHNVHQQAFKAKRSAAANDGCNPLKIDRNWQDKAACLSHPSELFFPENDNSRSETAMAKAICNTCPSKESCLEVAFRDSEQFGVWGGLTPRERTALRRARRGGSHV